jgi:cell wall-associated NlpC family hydrolase
MASAVKYLSNVAKSVKYASIDVLKELNPVITDHIETNADVAKTTYSTIKNFKSISAKAVKSLSNSQVGELAKEAKNNILEDIKKGTFYNKAREDKMFDAASADMFDGEDFDFSVDMSEDLDDTAMLAETIDNVGEKTSSAVSQVLARTAEYQVEATRQSTVRLLAQQSAMTATLHSDLSTVNANIAGVLKFNTEVAATHYENSKLFYETQQKQMDEQTSILKEMLDLQKSVLTPKSKSLNNKISASDLFTSTGALNIAEYFKYVKQNAKDNSSELGDMAELIQGVGIGRAIVSNPIGTIMKMAMKSMTPKMLKDAMAEFNETIAGSISTALINLTDMKDSTNPIFSAIGNMFGIDVTAKKKIGVGNYHKDATAWTGKDHKALVDVIPTLLGKIYSSVSGKDELRYDYESGTYKSMNQIQKDFKRMKSSSISDANEDILPYLQKYMNKLDFKGDDKRRQQLIDNLEKILEYNFDKAKYFNPKDRSLSAKTYGLKGDFADKDLDIIRKMFEAIPKNKQLKNQTSMIEGIHRFNEKMKKMEESGDSIFNALFDESVFDSKKNSPLFAATSKIDTTNEILGEILDTIRSWKIKGNNNYTGKNKSQPITKTVTAAENKKKDETEETIKFSSLGFNLEQNKDAKISLTDEDIDFLDDETDTGSEYIKGIKKAKTATQKLKAFLKGFNTLANQPVKFMANTLKKVDKRIYNILFGQGNGDDTESILGKMRDGLDDWFDDLKTRTRNKFDDIKDATDQYGVKNKFQSLMKTMFGFDMQTWEKDFKEALFGTKDKSFVEGMKDLFKEGFSDMWKGVKDIFKPVKEEAKKTVFGEKNEKGKAKEEKNNAFKDILYQAGRKPKDDGTGNTKDIPNAATGARQVSKTGVIAVSEGEVILPPDLNETNVKKRYRVENNAISKFKKAYGDIGNIQSFAEGGKFDPKKKYSSGYTHEELIELVRMAREEGMSSTEIYDMLVESMGFGKERIDRSDYVEGKENIFYKMKDAATDFVNSARENEFIDSVMGKIGKSISKKAPKEGQEVVEDVVGNFSQYLPRIAAGGVTGMALSALLGLAGGPLLGAAVGSGLGLLSKSKTLQTFLFGKEITNDDGTKGRDGSGLISKNIVNNVNKYFPNMVKGAIVGGITSLLPFIPGGPIAGIMVGSAVGFARSNDNLKTSLFGEEGKLTKIGKTLKEKLPKMGLGAAAMALGGPFGLTTNLILGAGLGFVSDTEKFKDIVFGTKGFDGKRAGGLVGFIRDAAEIPINGIRNLFNKTLDWFKTDILDPVKKGLGPFYQQLKNIGNWVKDGITNSFKDHITRPIGAFLIDKIIKPLETGVGKLINGILKPVKFVLSAPFKVFGAAGQALERRQLRKTGAASGTASERIRKREALDKNRKRKKYTNTAANTVDTMVSKATNEELEEYKMLNEIALSTGGLTGRKRKQKKIIDKYARSLVGKSGLDDLLYSHVQRNPRQLTLEDYKSIMNEVAEGNYEGSVALIAESPIFPEELKATACKKIKDTAKQVKDAREKAADFKTAARKIKEKTGVDVSQRSFGRVIDQEAKGRGLGNKTKNEKETEKQTSENKIPNLLQDNHNQAMDILTKISNTLEDIAHPEKRRRKKRNKKKQDEAPVTAVMTLSDAIQAQENGDTALANDIATGNITRFSQFKKKAKSSLNRMKAKAANKVKSVMTEHGIIKTRTDAQGNEIEDMRDSETRETVEKREESAKIQHGMFAKISSLTSGVLGFFGKGKDEEEEEEGGFLSFLGKILKFAGPALLGVGAIGLAKSAADKKIQVQKRDANGNKMYDENGNPIMTETTIADAVKDGASRMWLGDDLTGNTSGAWYHIKDFTRNTLIPTLGAGFDVILENIPKVISALTKTLVESAPEVLFAIGKGLGSGIWSVAKKYLSKIPGVGKLFGDDEEKDSDKKSSEDIESAGGNVTITKNLANKGSSAAPVSNSKGSSDIKLTESSSEIVSSMQKSFDATFGGSKTQQPKDTKTTSSAIQEAVTNISVSRNVATGIQTPMVAATSTVQAASNDDVKSSIAYSRACKSVQKKSLSQLSNIWNHPIFDDGTTTAQLCNDSETVIAQYTTDDGETVSVTGADILLYPEIASQVLGIDISLTDKERDENSEHIRNATGRDPGAYTAAKVILTGGGYGAMTAKRGIKAIHGLGNAAEKLGNGMYRASQVTKHIPGFRKVSKFVGGLGKFSGKAAKLHSRLAAVPLQATEGARKLYRGYSASRKAGKSVTESIKTTAGHFKNRMSKSVGKAQEAASAALDARKAKRAEKLANSKGLMSKITKPIKSVKNKVLDKADDAINKVVNIDANDVNKAKKGLTGAFSSLRSKSEKINKAASVVGNAADKVKDKAGKLTGKAAELADNLKTVLGNFFNSSDVLKKFEKVHKQCRKKFSSEAVSKALKEFSEKILEKFTKGLGKVAAKTISKVSAKLASYIGTAGIAAAAFLCIDFISGWSKADVIMQVEKPTTLEKLVSALVNAFAETFFITLIIDTKDLVQMSINMLEGLSFNFDDLRKRQKEAEEACDAYNREHGTNYTVDEYLEKDKISTKIKKGLKAAGKWVKDKASDAWDWTKKKASNLWNGAKSFLGFGDKDEDNEKETKEKEDKKESSNSEGPFFINVKGTAQTVTEQSSAINQVAESTENMADPEKLFYDDKGNVVGKGMDENGVMMTSYIPQGDAETSAEDAYVQYNMEHGTNYTMDEYNTITQQQQVGGDVTGTSPVNGLVGSKIAPISKNNSGIISSQNTSMIMKAAVQVNGMIPGMIKQCKSMIARLFGLPDSEMNKQNAKNAAIYKTKGPQTLFGQLTSMWKNIAAKVNPFANMLPRTMSTAMEGLSKFLAVSMGYADPTDENVDLSRVTTESYMDKRADIIAANSAFYNMTAGVSGSNSNNESTQVKAVKSSKSKKKSSKKKGILGTVADGAKSFIKGVGKLFGIGGSGSGINDTDAIQEPNPSEEYFVSQRYGNYASKSFTVQGDKSRQTISDAGCAPAAAVMAVNKATYNSLPLSMNDAIKNALPYKLPNGGVTADYFVDEFQRHNLGTSFIASEDENRKSNSIRDSLLSGKRVILMGKDENNTSKNRSPFGPKEHYVVATGLSKDKNTIYINDPERRKPNIAYNFKDIIKHTSLGIVPISRGKKKAPSANMNKLKKILKKFSASGKYGPDTIEYKVWTGLRAAGYSEITVAGTMGNIYGESGFDPSVVEKGNGIGFGLIQWSFGRRTAIEQYAASKGADPNTAELQIEWLLKECDPNDSSYAWMNSSTSYDGKSWSYDDWKNATDIESATRAFMFCFERPANASSLQKRVDAAKGYYEEFTGTAVPDGTTKPGEGKEDSGKKSVITALLEAFDKLGAAFGLTDGGDEGSTGEEGSSSGSTTVDINGITGNVSSNPQHAQKQKELVAKMKSVEGKLAYSQSQRDPETGSGDCSSTVQWAYKNVLGVDVGSWTGAQEDSPNTYVVANNVNDPSKLQLGDIILYRKNGNSSHVEMDYSTDQMIGHGGGSDGTKPGPTIKPLMQNMGSQSVAMVKRWTGFQGSGSGLTFVSQNDSNYANKSIGNEKVSAAGCAPAVATMAVNSVSGNTLDMNKAIRLASQYKSPTGGVTADYFVDEFDRHGLMPAFMDGKDNDVIMNHLANGNPVILMGQDPTNRSKTRSPFGPTNHYVLATGISKDRRTIYVNDPESKKSKLRYSKDILKHTTFGITPVKGKMKGSSSTMSKLRSRLKLMAGKANETILYSGDSRTEGMKLALGESSTLKFVCKPGTGYKWLKDTAVGKIKSIVKENPNTIVIFAFGVNDLPNIDYYTKLYKKFADEIKANIWYMSVNPVDSSVQGPYDSVDNTKIETFNAKLKSFAGSRYIDTYSYLLTDGFTAPDSLHYDNDTYKKIHEYCLSAVNGTAPESANGSTSSASQSPITAILDAFEQLSNAYMGIDPSTTGSSSGSTSGSAYPKYDLDNSQKDLAAGIIAGETGGSDPVAAAQEASQMANLNEVQYGRQATGADLRRTLTGGWYASTSMDNAPTDVTRKAVEDVLVNGKRTLPRYVTEHDMFPLDAAIDGHWGNGKSEDRSQYKQHTTKIKQNPGRFSGGGATYTFWDFFGQNKDGDVSGYYDKYYQQYKDDIAWSAGSGSGISDKAPTYNYGNKSPQSGSSSRIVSANQTKQVQQSSNVDKLIDVVITLLSQVVDNTSSIKDIAKLLVNIIDIKGTSGSSADNTVASDLLATKTLALKALKDSAKNTKDQALENLIRNVEAIARQ